MYSNFNAFYYKQNNQEYISLVLPFKIVNSISEVLVYGKSKYGYQRELSSNHYNQIKRNILKENIILPTSIILSANKDDIEPNIKNIKDGLIELNIRTDNKVFRIVDGQHRLKGLEEAAKENSDINDFMLNVVILLTDRNNRIIEVDTFIDINSKAKKIKTDLTLLAKYNYEILGEKEIDDVYEHICVKVAYLLHEKIEDSVWKNAIKFEFNVSRNNGIIEVNAFKQSIASLVKTIIDKKGLKVVNDIDIIDDIAKKVAEIINLEWKLIKDRWEACFEEKIEKDIENEFVKTYYNSKYYIQKTTGANALNMILNEILQSTDTIDEAFESFKIILKKSLIKSDDWLVGKKFSGLTSGSGFKKAKDFIKNEQ
ncbi:DGQHR domain-containing protein [Clostridium sp. YIM B02506]|uniref:DGQHR domain-containing protein n=1 Tax=Clostridium sp. YIM B02506 TaxID=2910680 RepID=UPI001EEE5C95|nr:DGQHR domain-containing protein [Clostridium sp. YIM B02506]